MARLKTLAETVMPVAKRRAWIESQPLPCNIAALIAEAATEAGDRLAWNFFESGETITYAALRRSVNGIARELSGIDIAKGTHVAVMMPNVAAMPLSWLALGTLGAVMVPVNVNYTKRELAYVVNDSDAEYVFVHRHCLPVLEQCIDAGDIRIDPARIIVVDPPAKSRYRDWATLTGSPVDDYTPPEPVALDDLLNIQYTSGTTGFPKGCMLTQRYWVVSGKVNAFRDARRYGRILASTPFYYMDPQWLLMMTFYQRGTLFVAAKQSVSRFMGWVRTYGINFCLFPYLIFKQPETPDDGRNDVVRANVYGVPREIHALIEQRFDLVLREAFGMTEVGSAMFMPIEATDMVGSGACGLPSPFRECAVFDADGKPVTQGDVGELCIRGPGIMLGYYNNAAATKAAFRDGWFRTGDLFRVDARGYFYIVGRQKDMIRRSSENIAAREVESVLNGIPVVLESAAVAVPDETRGEEVKAYIVLGPDTAPSDAVLGDIILQCQRQLAKFKVPRYYAFRTALPKTPSLKIAKQQLRSEARAVSEPTYDRVTGQWL
jgi:acyl-CoA synthetase (AMP-forming)/AMP-acid ligase II